MSLSAAPVVESGLRHSTFDSLRVGRTSQFIVCHLLRFWDSRNIKKGGEFMGITLLFLDEKNSMIHGFVPAARANHYRPFLETGAIVKVDRFEVARCPTMYKITEHTFVIRFIPATTITEVQTAPPLINLQKFMLRQFDHLHVLANTNLELPDVVGQIRGVQGSDLSNDAAATRVVVRLLIDPVETVYLSLWDEAASTFRGLLKSGEKLQSVMVITTVNPKIFGGNLYLNSTPATKFYFNTNLPEISEFTKSLGGTSSDVFQCVDTMEGLKKKEVVSIGDLNTFISNSNEQTQEADFLCKARIVGVLHQNGWSFVSCTGCNKKLEKSGTSLRCNKCVTPNITGVIRFRVELAVDDGDDSATFVVFDKEMTKLTRKEAAVLALEEMPNGGEEELPSCLEELAGKEFMFQIRVTPYNFTPNHCTFTVSTITEDLGINNQPERPASPKRVEASSSKPVVAEKLTKAGNTATPPGVENMEKTRKRSRE